MLGFDPIGGYPCSVTTEQTAQGVRGLVRDRIHQGGVERQIDRRQLEIDLGAVTEGNDPALDSDPGRARPHRIERMDGDGLGIEADLGIKVGQWVRKSLVGARGIRDAHAPLQLVVGDCVSDETTGGQQCNADITGANVEHVENLGHDLR